MAKRRGAHYTNLIQYAIKPESKVRVAKYISYAKRLFGPEISIKKNFIVLILLFFPRSTSLSSFFSTDLCNFGALGRLAWPETDLRSFAVQLKNSGSGHSESDK